MDASAAPAYAMRPSLRDSMVRGQDIRVRVRPGLKAGRSGGTVRDPWFDPTAGRPRRDNRHINTNAKGNKFELDVWRDLEADGWACGSRRKGPRYATEQPGDILAWKPGERAMLVECTAGGRGPWQNKTPAERQALRDVARKLRAVPVIAWKGPSGPVYLDEVEWPT